MKKKITILMVMFLNICMSSCTGKQNVVIEDENLYNPINETVTIIFENNDGTIISNQIVKYGEKIVIPQNFEKNNSPRYTYKFVGWDLNGDSQVDQIPEVATTSFVAQAIYEYSLNEYKVVFNPDCDSYTGQLTQNVGFGQSAVAPTNLVKDGYDFVSWDKAFDYIIGEATINAVWTRHKFTIHLSGNNEMSIGAINDYTIDAFYGYSNSLPIPNKIHTDTIFNGWKDSNGKMITNAFGDVLEPICSFDDIYLQIDCLSVLDNSIFTLSKLHRNEIKNEELNNKLLNYVDLYSITSDYFYFDNTFYYQKNDSFEYGYLIDYILLGEDDTVWYLDGSNTKYVFLSIDVIDFTLVDNYQSTLDKFINDSTQMLGISESISLPYARKISEMNFHPDDYDESLLDTLMYDKDNNCYRTDYNKSMQLLGNESYDSASLTYLIAKTNQEKNTPYQYTDVNGVVGTIDNNTKYGVRYLLSVPLQKW